MEMVRKPIPPRKNFARAIAEIRRGIREANVAYDRLVMYTTAEERDKHRSEVYAALERAQHAAFDAKDLFGFDTEPPPMAENIHRGRISVAQELNR